MDAAEYGEIDVSVCIHEIGHHRSFRGVVGGETDGDIRKRHVIWVGHCLVRAADNDFKLVVLFYYRLIFGGKQNGLHLIYILEIQDILGCGAADKRQRNGY